MEREDKFLLVIAVVIALVLGGLCGIADYSRQHPQYEQREEGKKIDKDLSEKYKKTEDKEDEFPTFVNEEVAAMVKNAGISDTPYESSVKTDNKLTIEIGGTYKLSNNIVIGNTKSNLKEMYGYVAKENIDAEMAMILLGQADLTGKGATISIANLSGLIAEIRFIDDGQFGLYNGYKVYTYTSDIKGYRIK